MQASGGTDSEIRQSAAAAKRVKGTSPRREAQTGAAESERQEKARATSTDAAANGERGQGPVAHERKSLVIVAGEEARAGETDDPCVRVRRTRDNGQLGPAESDAF